MLVETFCTNLVGVHKHFHKQTKIPKCITDYAKLNNLIRLRCVIGIFFDIICAEDAFLFHIVTEDAIF